MWLVIGKLTEFIYNLTFSFLSVGEFGSFMQVHIQNDGPVTIPIESPASWSSVKKGGVCN